jgi:hypothetical protein
VRWSTWVALCPVVKFQFRPRKSRPLRIGHCLRRKRKFEVRKFLHKFVIVYPDDVCAYNLTLDEHLKHLRLMLQCFKEEGLELRLKKCFFGLNEMDYLGCTVSGGKILDSTKKVEAV